MFHQVIAVLSDVQDRAMRLSRMSTNPQQPLSTGIPARPFLPLPSDIRRIFLILLLPLLLNLTLPPSLFFVSYHTSPSLSSSPSAAPNSIDQQLRGLQ